MSAVLTPVLRLQRGSVLCPFGYESTHRELVTHVQRDRGVVTLRTLDNTEEPAAREYVWAVDDVTNVSLICEVQDGEDTWWTNDEE